MAKGPEEPLLLSDPQKKDLQVAILLGLGLDIEAISHIVDYSRRNIYHRLEGSNQVLIQDLRAFVSRQMDLNRAALEDVVRDKAIERVEKMLPKVVRNIEQALDETKDKRLRYQAAKDQLHQLLGRPRQAIVDDRPPLQQVFRVSVKSLQMIHQAISVQASAANVLPLPDEDDEDFTG